MIRIRCRGLRRAALTLLLGGAVGLLPGTSQAAEEETAGNNLSFPVIWAEGVAKALRGSPGMPPLLAGQWWYWWGTEGTDPNIVPLSCLPDPDNSFRCDDGSPQSASGELAGGGTPGRRVHMAWLQKEENNVWQAEAMDGSAAPVVVDWINWGDNLESVDWYTRSMVRTEVVLFKDNPDPLLAPWLEYEMRHVSGWGIDEVHGLAADPYHGVVEGPGAQATIYSPCARLTIQKLLVPRENIGAGDLVWIPGNGWTEDPAYVGEAVNPPIFNMAVYEGGDGPGYYAAEINVKGRVIFGYTWNVRNLNDPTPVPPGTIPSAAGDYRITFSFDPVCNTVPLNTYFVDGVTAILEPVEEDTSLEAAPTGGGTAVLDTSLNITYIDVRILERTVGSVLF